MKYTFTKTDKKIIKEARKQNKDKRVEARLRALERVQIKSSSKIIASMITERKIESSLS